MSASPQYYECIDETFEEVESKLEELESDPDIAAAEGVLNVTFSNGVVFVLSRQPAVEQLWLATPGGGFHFVWRMPMKSGSTPKPTTVSSAVEPRTSRACG